MFESTADEICGFQKAENALKAYLPLKITDDKSHLFKILVNFSESFSGCLFGIIFERSKKKSASMAVFQMIDIRSIKSGSCFSRHHALQR